MDDPYGTLAKIKGSKMDQYPELTPEQVLSVQAVAQRTISKRDQELSRLQDEAGRNMLVSLWRGELTKLEDVTDALDKNLITVSMAESLRKVMLTPREGTPAEKLAAESEVRDIIESYRIGEITKQQALEGLYHYADILGATKGSSLLDVLYEAPDKLLAEMTREAKSLMEEYIRTRDPLSGMFRDDKVEIMATAEARLLLDIAIEEAKKKGKPLGRRDTLIRAMEVGQQMRTKTEKATKQTVPTVPKELGETPPAGTPARVGTDGPVYGTHNGDGAITLSETGVRMLLQQAEGDTIEERIKNARKLAEANGWIIPEK